MRNAVAGEWAMVGEHDCLSMARGRVVEDGLAEGRRVFGARCV